LPTIPPQSLPSRWFQDFSVNPNTKQEGKHDKIVVRPYCWRSSTCSWMARCGCRNSQV